MRLDAHQHFWNYDPAQHVWMTDVMEVLRRDYLPAELKPLLQQIQFDGTIAVQARQMVEETEWLLKLADEHEFIRGVVGWVDLRSPKLREQLEKYARHPKLVGVRHVVHDEPDDDFMRRPEFRRGIAHLSEFNLTYDLLLFPKHLPVAVELVSEFRGQPFVLDHIAKPAIRDGQVSPWREDLKRLAEFPNVCCKLSGMVTEAKWKQWRPEEFYRHLDIVIGAFGADRVMIGSDWPVCTLSGDYVTTMRIVNGKRIESITTLSGRTYCSKMFIDATYVGDLMAAAGVTHTVGREPESQYGEDVAGVRRGDTKPRVHHTHGDKDHFIKDVDPYVKPGDTNGGLLPLILNIPGLANGQGDKEIQTYNYRVCLTTDPKPRIPIEKHAGYREVDHELLPRNFEAGDQRLPALIEPLAGEKSKMHWNNIHAVGSDLPGANADYPEASYERRHEIEQEHQNYIRGFLWTMANNPRVSADIRKKTAAYGLCKDEFTNNGGWPWMIYIREARRMVGNYVMTQQDCEGKKSAPDPVALGSFGMDSHVVQHFVTTRGGVISDCVIWRVPPRPYGISYGSIVPRKGECENLFSPICVSASHVAHGSIRMEPVFMALSQSAAVAAGLAIDSKVSVQDVAYPALHDKLLAAKQVVDVSQVPVSKQKAAKKNSTP